MEEKTENELGLERDLATLEADRQRRIAEGRAKSDQVHAQAFRLGGLAYYRATADSVAHGRLIRKGTEFSIDAAHRPSTSWVPLEAALSLKAEIVSPDATCGSCACNPGSPS